ncbi:MAG: hypothetical protein Q9226_001289 [Calogaya cf. arnoldii]
MGKKRSSKIVGPSSGQEIRKRIVENVTLMRAMCEIPTLPKENELRQDYDERRRLSIDRERQLVDVFAFIAASTDNSLRVMAVCIEEDSDQHGVTIRLASNTGDLSRIIRSFNGIARTLEKASSKAQSRLDIRKELFRQVVILDESRILSRLRSRHAAKTQYSSGKAEPLALLSRTLRDIPNPADNETTKNCLTRVRISSQQLSKKFAEFEAVRKSDGLSNASCDLLIELLILISEFDIPSLEIALELSHRIDPSTKKDLPHKLRKLGQYYRFTCDLIDAARSSQSALFQRISVQALNQPCLDMTFVADRSIGFDQTFQRVTSSSRQYHPGNFQPQAAAAVRQKFESRMADRATRWKVHAEIQILLFYEQNPSLSRPRIIGSSKSACYLCNLFIQHHGKFQVPRSHGKLYDRWMLPGPALDHLQANNHLRSAADKLNASLEAQIIDFLNHTRRRLPNPAESVAILPEPFSSNSTLASRMGSRRSIRGTIEPALVPLEPPGDDLCAASSHSVSSTTSSTAGSTATKHRPSDDIQAVPGSLLPEATTTFRFLSLGDTAFCKLNHECDVFIVETDTGSLYISWDTPLIEVSFDQTISSCACWVQVTSLSSGAQTDQPLERLEEVDVHSLVPGQDHVVENGSALSSKELTLQLKSQTLLVKYSFEDPEKHQSSKNGEGRSP